MPPRDSMPCPFCGAILTAEKDRDRTGRYRCTPCSSTYAEAQKGWLPTMANAVARKKDAAPKLETPPTAHDPMFAVRSDGEPITRQRTCECGTAFTQRLLSERFCTAVEAAGGMRAVLRQIPDLYVPVHCPRCERIDLGRQARIDTSREGDRRHSSEPEFAWAAD
jgi:DNA-directed RNA polymerase subunit M/transcription elongation factor TFIIS